jgi:hypothetical protein
VISAVPRRPLRRFLRLLAMVASVSLTSCGVFRSAGGNFVTGAVQRLEEGDSALVALQRTLADSAGTFLQQEFEEAVIGPAKATWSEMRKGLREEADSVGLRLTEVIRVNLEETLPRVIQRNADVLEVRTRALAGVFAEELTRALGEGVAESLEPAVESLVQGAVRSAAESVESELRPSLHALMLDLRDSLQVRIGDVDRAVAESQTVSGFRYTLFGAGGAFLLALIALGINDRRRRGQALGALIDAIEKEGHPGTKRAAASCAKEAGVHSWLGDRVRSRTAGPGWDGEGEQPSPEESES